MWLIVGLGNPGKQYQGNRHNIGFSVVDELLRRTKISPTRVKFGAEIADGELSDEKVLFCKPMEFMNVSGQAVVRTAQFWKIPPERTVVIHDDLDLPFGRIRLGAGGGHGGNNGVRSIIEEWGNPEFCRIRVGIGRPRPGQDPAAYVLSNFGRDEQSQLPAVIATSADATETIVRSGLVAAMNKFNSKKKTEEAPTS